MRRGGGGTIYDDDWFLGGSCYIYISLVYVLRDAEFWSEARVNSVTTKRSVNSGTTVVDSNIHFACIGYSEEEGGVYLEDDIENPPANYTTTLMSNWPYVSIGGPCLGANYRVTAERPSGESQEHIVSQYVFLA